MYRIVIMSEDNHVLFSEREQNIPFLVRGDSILIDNKYIDLEGKYIINDIVYEFQEDEYNNREIVVKYHVKK